MQISILFVTAIALVYSAEIPIDTQSVPITARILEETSTPILYDIELAPYLDNEGDKSFTFDGKLTLRFQINVVSGRTSLQLNSNRLTYKSVPTIKKVDENPETLDDILVTNTLEDLKDNGGIIEFNFDTTLEYGAQYDMSFEYTGELAADMGGFYRSSYEENGKKIWIGTTQFQSYGARRVFPSFDEPNYKSEFRVAMIKLIEYEAISNTRPEGPAQEVADPLRNRVQFKTTPTMSSYLLAFIVAPFKSLESTDGRLAIWAREDQILQTKYALEVGEKTLTDLISWTAIDYYSMENIEKMDMAAIPDFSAGAMENWGLLTYREAYLLSDEVSTNLKTIQNIASVIAHEQAHQWFGDLVTCESWGLTWLNEGFANYFGHMTVSTAEPDMKMERQFPLDNVQRGLEADGDENGSPMTSNSAASLIVYQKSGSVIRMIEHYMGSSIFQSGIRNYLVERSYKSTRPEHLFEHLDNAAGPRYNIIEYFTKWSTQPGYPVVNVQLNSATNLTITQHRFLYRVRNPNTIVDKTLKWPVPIAYTLPNEKFTVLTPRFTLPDDVDEYVLEANVEEKWIILNTQQTGFYRVNYDNTLWDRIRDALLTDDFDGIDEINRGQIIDDILNLARSDFEDLDYNRALDVVSFLKADTSFLSWSAFFVHMTFLTTRLPTSLIYPYVLEMTEDIYTKLTFEAGTDKNRFNIYNRANVITWACKSGNEDCIKTANELFTQYQLDPVANRIEVNIRPAVLCTAIRQGGKAEYDFLYEQFQKEQVMTEKLVILTALGCLSANASGGAELLLQHWTNVLGSDVRDQDRRSVLTASYTNTVDNVPFIVDLIVEHYQTIERLGGKSEVTSTITAIIPRIVAENEAYLTKLKAFIAENSDYFSGAMNSIEEAYSEYEYNKKWSETHQPIIREYVGSAVNLNAISLISMLAIALMAYFIN